MDYTRTDERVEFETGLTNSGPEFGKITGLSSGDARLGNRFRFQSTGRQTITSETMLPQKPRWIFNPNEGSSKHRVNGIHLR